MNIQKTLGRTCFRTAMIVFMPVVVVLCAFLWCLAQLANPEA